MASSSASRSTPTTAATGLWCRVTTTSIAVGGVGHEPGHPPGAGGGHAEVLTGAHRETV